MAVHGIKVVKDNAVNQFFIKPTTQQVYLPERFQKKLALAGGDAIPVEAVNVPWLTANVSIAIDQLTAQQIEQVTVAIRMAFSNFDAGGGTPGLPPGRGFNSFEALKEALGDAGKNKVWHHIVEQNQVQKSGFSPQQVQNTNNVVAIESGFIGSIHGKISGHFSSTTQRYTNGMTVRNWLAGQSFEFQFEYGLQQLRRYGTLTQTTTGWIFTPF